MDRRARMLRTLDVLGIEVTLTDAVDGKYEIKNLNIIHRGNIICFIEKEREKNPKPFLFQNFEFIAAPGFRHRDAT